MAGEEPGPPPPWFDAANGLVMTTIATATPAKLRTGTLGTCRRFVSTSTATVTNTCAVTGGTFTIGDGQTLTITKTQVIEGSRGSLNGKPYVIYWFIGTASVPAGAPAVLIVTRDQDSTHFEGNVEFRNFGSKSAVVLDIVGG